MVKLFNRFRTDKKFQRNVIIGIVVALFILNTRTDIPTQSFASSSICADIEDNFHFFFDIVDVDNCIVANCIYWESLDVGGGKRCTPGIPDNEFILQATEYTEAFPNIYPSSMCSSCEGCYREDTTGFNKWQCIPEQVAEITGSVCKKWQKPFSDILDSVWKKNKIGSCNSKAYLVIGFGAFAALAVI